MILIIIVFMMMMNLGEFFCYIQGTVNIILKHKTFIMKTSKVLPTTTSFPPVQPIPVSKFNSPIIITKPPKPGPIPGIYIDNYQSSLPMGKGLSSSASVCVLVATCFNLVYDLNWSREEIMEIAYLGRIIRFS